MVILVRVNSVRLPIFGLLLLLGLLAGCSGAVLPPAAPAPVAPPDAAPVGWTPLNGPPGPVYALAADDGTPQTMFAGTREGVYRSTDGGAHWAATGWPEEAPGRVTALLWVPRTLGGPPGLLAGTAAGLWRWSAGTGWRRIALGDGAHLGITTLARGMTGLKEALPVYAGTTQGLYASVDAGATWERVGTNRAIVRAVMDLPEGRGLYVATNSALRVQKRDGQWEDAPPGLGAGATMPQVLALHDGWPLMVATDRGVYRLSSGEWTRLTSSPAQTLAPVSRAWVVGGDTGVILAREVDDDAAQMQRDGATQVVGLPAAPVYALLRVGERVFAASEGGVYVSTDGVRWTMRAAGLPPAAQIDGLVAIGGEHPAELYVGGPAGVFRSDNMGTTWRLAAAGLPPGGARDLALTPGDGPALYAATANGIYSSGDGAATWQPTAGQPGNRDVRRLWIDPADRQRIYAGLGGAGGLAYTWNGGQDWVAPATRQPPGVLITALLIDPAAPSRPYAGVRYGRRDGPLTDPGAAVWRPEADSNIGEMVWRSAGAGIRLERGGGDGVVALAELAGDGRLLATTAAGAVWSGAPGETGLRWAVAAWPAGLAGAGLAGAVATYPQRAEIVYAAGGQTVARRTALTATWEALGRPPAGRGVNGLAVLPLGIAVPGRVSAQVVAAVPGRGLWQYTDDQLPVPPAAPPRPPAPTDRVPPGDPAYFDYFEETGHNLGGGFREFWYANDGLFLYGFPITEEFHEFNAADNITRTVQYFERGRLELHLDPKNGAARIQVGLLGRELTQGEFFVSSRFFVGDAGRAYFGETQHSISGAFYTFWRKHGGLARFGFPISEEIKRGATTVQYFERARLEWHPEFAYQDIDKEVSLALLGVEALRKRGWLPP
jgi:hypothetical protein